MPKWKPIEEKFLEPNRRMGLFWKEGIVFIRVLTTRDSQWSPFDENFEQISVGESTGPTELKDSNNNRILEIPKTKAPKIVYHAGIGFNPDLYCYPEYPSGQKLGRFLNVDPPRTGDIHTFISGDQSPFKEPTERMEFVFPFGMDIQLDFYNPGTGNREVQPILNILIRKYLIEVLDSRDPNDAAIIALMARGQIGWYPFPMGPIENLSSFDTLGEYWPVDPISLRNAAKLTRRS